MSEATLQNYRDQFRREVGIDCELDDLTLRQLIQKIGVLSSSELTDREVLEEMKNLQVREGN